MIIKAPAKINLGLSVLRRRTDGYHDLESVMQQVSLADVLKLQPKREPGWSFYCSDKLLETNDNLVPRAAALLAREAGGARLLPGVAINLYKNIPTGSGLAGGSSDAAAALVGLNRFWRLGMSLSGLNGLAAILGSDVPFCLRGGTALATGRGEKLDKLTDLPFFWVVLAAPAGLTLLTADIFRVFEPERSIRPQLQDLVKAIRHAHKDRIREWLAGGLTNSLESAVLPGYPIVNSLKEQFKLLGLDPAMSGSGPSVFALTDSYPAAREAARALQATGWRAFLCWTQKGVI